MSYKIKARNKGLNLLFVDPGIVYTGYAIWNHKYGTGFLRDIIDVGALESCITHDSILLRARSMAEQTIGICRQYSVDAVWVEQPPQTIYNQHMPKNALIARAQSVFKTFAVTYNIFGMLCAEKIKHYDILPKQWQGKKAKGETVKEKSIRLANDHLEIFSKFRYRLKTKRDENTADAINIGHHVLDQLELETYGI